MGRRLPPLSALRAFEAAGRHLSFSRAAQELFVTQGAISRHVRALEVHLNVLLFRRMNRRVELTADGAGYLATLRDGFDRIEAGTIALERRQARDTLTISVLPTLAMQWLVPRLASFFEANPTVEVRLAMSADPVDFGRDSVDAAIRVGTLPGNDNGASAAQPMTVDWTGVQTDRMLRDSLILVCSPSLLSNGASLRTAADLDQQVLLHTATRRQAWPEWLRATGAPEPIPRAEHWFGHFFMTQQAARNGRGIAVLPSFLISDDLRAGTLVAPLGQAVASPASYYLLFRARQADTPELMLFRQWLRQQTALTEA
jgi:LysR family glycine cleavage system transcriptional activator